MSKSPDQKVADFKAIILQNQEAVEKVTSKEVAHEEPLPEEKLRQWKIAIKDRLNVDNFLSWSEFDKDALVAEYNALVEECRKRGLTSESRYDSIEQFAATLKKAPKTPDIAKLRKQLHIKEK